MVAAGRGPGRVTDIKARPFLAGPFSETVRIF